MSVVQTVGATTKLSQHEILPSPTDVGALANRINHETKALHNKIDRMITLKLALAYRDARIYRQGLQSFYHVFATMERCLMKQFERDDQWTDILKQVWKPEMARTEKCEQDLLFYYDNRHDKFSSPIMSEQMKFVEHIETVTAEKPYLLLAYLHVMYLALFAGGRIMRSSISKATGLFPQKDGLKHEDIIRLGANFYTFDVADEDAFRLLYKRDYELVTRPSVTEEQKIEIIEEAKYIFAQNAKCISEIEQHNLARMSKKWAYIAATKGYYAVMVLAALLILFYIRRIILHLF